MNNDQTPVKKIITAVEEYYNGRDLQEICEEHDISQELFNSWLAEYKYITVDLMELKLENERLRKLFVDQFLKLHFSGSAEK